MHIKWGNTIVDLSLLCLRGRDWDKHQKQSKYSNSNYNIKDLLIKTIKKG